MTAQETSVVNAVSTTLNATMAAGATSCSITSASGFPSVPFYIVIDPDDPAKREYMLIDSSIVGTTLSMTNVNKRNLSGSAGDVEHASGAVVRVSPPMKQLFDDIHDRADLILKVSGVTAGDTFYVSSVSSGQATFARVPKGTADQVWRMNSGETAPEWANLALTSQVANASGNVTLPLTTLTTIVTTPSLSVGTWLVTGGAMLGSAGANSVIEITLTTGTATATFAGNQSATANDVDAFLQSASVASIVTVTVAGTILLRGYATGAAGTAYAATADQAYPKASGLACVKIA